MVVELAGGVGVATDAGREAASRRASSVSGSSRFSSAFEFLDFLEVRLLECRISRE